MTDTKENPGETPRSRLLPAIAASLPFVFTFLACGLYVVTLSVSNRGGGAGVWQSTLEMGPPAAFSILITTVGSAIGIAVCLFLAGRGKRVPSAVAVFLASVPWLVGVAFEVLGLTRVWNAVEYADPSQRATLMAAGISEATLSTLFAAVLASGLFASVGLGLGLASIAQAAPRRSAVGALIGGALTLPALGLTGYALLFARESGLILVVTGLGAVLAAVVGGFGIGSDEPHGRSAALGAAAPIAGGLAVAMAGAAASKAAFVTVFGALAYVAPDERGSILAASVGELAPMALVSSWGAPLAFVGAAGLAGWSLTRSRPRLGRILGAVALLGVVGVALGADRLVASWAETHVERVSQTPWSDAARFEPAAFAEPAEERPDRLLTSTGLARLDGTAVTDGSLDALRDDLASFSVGQGEPLPDEDPSEFDFQRPAEVRIALDERVDAAGLRAFVEALAGASIVSVQLQGRSRSGLPPASRETVSEAFPALAAAFSGHGGADFVVGGSVPGAVPASDRVLRHVTLGASAPDQFEVRNGARVSDRQLGTSGDWGYDRRQPLYVVIGDGATGASLAELCTRALHHDLIPVLVVGPVPGLVPRQLLAGVLVEDTIGGGGPLPALSTGGGQVLIGSLEDESGEGMFDPSTVTASLRARSRAIQSCYERELRNDPTLAGRVLVRFTVQTTGTVSGATATENTTGSLVVARCAVSTISRLRFRPGPEGGSVTFAYPFTFSPSP